MRVSRSTTAEDLLWNWKEPLRAPGLMQTFAGMIDRRGKSPYPVIPPPPPGYTPRTTMPSQAEIEAMTPDWLKDSWRMEEKIGKEITRTMARAFAAGAEYVSLVTGGRETGRIYADGRYEAAPWEP